MKKQIFTLLAIIMAVLSFAQNNNGFNYKALITENGNPLIQQPVTLQFNILFNGSVSVYEELQTTTTDSHGIVSVNIGEGMPISGDFLTIDWSAADLYLNVKVDTGNGFVDFGTSAFNFVPYAKYANEAGNVFSGNFNDLLNIPTGLSDGDDVNDADHDATNELQSLSINGNQLSISNGNTVTLPSGSGNGAQQIDDLSDAHVTSNSVYLGQGAGDNDDGTDNSNIAVGQDALYNNTSGYNNTALGTESLSSNTVGADNVGVGANTLTYNTNKNNLVAIGSNALYNNGNGASANNEAISNTAVGSYAMYYNNKGSYNTALGWQSLYRNTEGIKNTSLGNKALHDNSTGNGNTATGYNALITNTTGSYNVANGFSALSSNTTGHSNVAIGVKALYSNIDKSNLIAVGDSALYSNTTGECNTAIGSESMLNNESGNYNTSTGYHSLFNNTSGICNTAYGSGALKMNGTGNYNTAIGYDAYFYNNLDNTICIGYNSGGMAEADNRVEIGNSSITWIGGQVGWSTYSDRRIKKDIEENVAGLDFITRLRPVTYHLDIHKQNQMKNRGKNIKKEAEWDSKYDIEQIRMTGFIAQEVEQAAKEAGYDFSGVQKANDELGMYSVRYSEFVVPLVKAVQEQQEIIKNQQNKINDLQKQIDELKALIINNKK